MWFVAIVVIGVALGLVAAWWLASNEFTDFKRKAWAALIALAALATALWTAISNIDWPL